MIFQKAGNYLRVVCSGTSKKHSMVPTQLTRGGGWKEGIGHIKKGLASPAKDFGL